MYGQRRTYTVSGIHFDKDPKKLTFQHGDNNDYISMD